MIILLAGALVALSVASCVKEFESFTEQKFEFYGGWAESGKTRTVLQPDGKSVWWSVGEEINIFYGNVSSGKFTSTNTAESQTVYFRGTLPVQTGIADNLSHSFWAVYPYDAANTCDGNSVTLTVPDRQSGAAGTFADHFFPAVALNEGMDLSFFNVCGGACFSVVHEGIESVRFKSLGGEPLVGRVRVCFGPDGTPVVKEVLDPKSEVLVYAPEGGFVPGEKYFAAFIPGPLSHGLSISFTTRDQAGTFNMEKEIMVNRSLFGLLQGLDSDVEFIDDPAIIDPDDLVSVHNPLKGGLEDALTELGDYKSIRALKVTGTMNDIDFRFIRDLENLRYLDISCIDNVSLPSKAFYESSNVSQLVLPKNLAEIEDNMFGFSNLEQITIMRHVSRIGTAAFENCTSLISIIIPSSVESIGLAAFWNCSSLVSVSFEPNSRLRSFETSSTITVPYLVSPLKGAFMGCSALASIELPASLNTIGANTFYNCSSLTSLSFAPGSHLSLIGEGVFRGCSSLNTVTIPSSVVTISSDAFCDCNSLSSVFFEDGSRLREIGRYAFSGCSTLTAIEIPADVEIIDEGAFCECTSLSSVVFAPDSHLKAFGDDSHWDTIYGSFANCKALTSIVIPSSVEKICVATFRNCSSLSSVCFLPDSHLNIILHGAFSGCTALASIEIPASVNKISVEAFRNCTSLSSVSFEENSSLKTIGGDSFVNTDIRYTEGSFAGCSDLTSIIIPASVETIKSSAFDGCISLSSVVFEENSSLTQLENRTFYNCKSLTKVTFKRGSRLTTIGGGENYYYSSNSPFYNCQLKSFDASGCSCLQSISGCFYGQSNLRLFYCGAEIPPSIDPYEFYGIDPYALLKVPDTCVEAYKADKNWSSQFLSITGFNE